MPPYEDNRPACSICQHKALDGYEYCLDHILRDKVAPYKQCSFVLSSGNKRCSNAALIRGDKPNVFCRQHMYRFLEAKRRRYCSTHKIPPLRQRLRTSLSHLTVQSMAHQTPPLFQYIGNEYLECESSDEDLYSGDIQSLPCQSFEPAPYSSRSHPLDHAAHYTSDEILRILRDKQIRLQTLYRQQFSWLRRSLKQAHTNKEKSQPSRELLRYRRYHGQDALLRRQYADKRRIMTSHGTVGVSRVPLTKCSVCGDIALPCTKHCLRHSVKDSAQFLFRPCPISSGEKSCPEVICPHLGQTECAMHRIIPPIKCILPT